MKSLTTVSRSPAETARWGERLGKLLHGGEIIGLTGELGSGKTCLARGLAQGLEVEKNTWLRSPTFTLINEYSGRLPIYHIDLYRVPTAREQEGLDLRDYLYGGGVTVVEWFQYLAAEEVGEHLEIELQHRRAHARTLVFHAHGERYETILVRLARAWGRNRDTV